MISVEQTQTIHLGRTGEQDVTEIVFNIAPWIAQFGQGNVLLNVKRACDTIPYPANIVVVGNTAVWTVSKKDVESYGTGKAELTYLVDGQIKKSVIYKTYTEKSLADITPTPENGNTWLDAMTKQVLKAEGHSTQAESYAHGGTGARVDENIDNAKYYKEQADLDAQTTDADRQVVEQAKTEVLESAKEVGLNKQAVENVEKNVADAELRIGKVEDDVKLMQTDVQSNKDAVDLAKTEITGMQTDVTTKAKQVATDKDTVVKAVNGFDQKVTDATGTINTAKTKAITDIDTAKTGAVGSVTAEGTTQVNAVKQEGTTQKQAIDDAVNGIVADRAQIEQNKNDILSIKKDLYIKEAKDIELEKNWIENSFAYDAGNKVLVKEDVGWNYLRISVKEGEKYKVNYMSQYGTTFYVTDVNNNTLIIGNKSGSSDIKFYEQEIVIPNEGTFVYISARKNLLNRVSVIQHIFEYNLIIADYESIKSKVNQNFIKQKQYTICELSPFKDGYFIINGTERPDAGYSYTTAPLVSGEIYEIKYAAIWSTTYEIVDKNNKVIQRGKMPNNGDWKYYSDTVIAPEGSTKIYLICANRENAKANISVLLEKIITVNKQETFMKSNILSGKKWVACGDSFTEGNTVDKNEYPYFLDEPYIGCRKSYPYWIARRNNMILVNKGLSGSTMAKPKDGHGITPFVDISRYQSIDKDADYVTLWFGINDANHCTLGTIEDMVDNTFYGAYNIVIDWILKNVPNAKVGLVVTPQSYKTFREAIRNIALKWGISCLDMMGDKNIPPIVSNREDNIAVSEEISTLTMQKYCVDYPSNTHPSAKGHRFISTIVENWLRSL